MSSLSDAIKEAYVIASARRIIVKTLSISSEEIESLNIVHGVQDFTANLDGISTVFLAVPFELVPPSQNDEGASMLSVSVDILAPTVFDFFKNIVKINSPVKIIYREWTSETGTWISGMPLELSLKSVSLTERVASVMAGFMDIVNRAFPYKIYTPNTFFTLRY